MQNVSAFFVRACYVGGLQVGEEGEDKLKKN